MALNESSIHEETLAGLSKALAEKEISCVELTEYYLQRIKTLDKTLNTFITVTDEHALQQAKEADKKYQNGTATTLTGIPIAHKDIFCTQGIKTTCGSKMLNDFIALYNATVVENLNRAGTIMLGKTNMDEFAMGSTNENSYHGPVGNPWNLNHAPGGSSGGSAAAVAARLVAAATGTDTGGSIRQPAAYCGITGIKPTYGLVSRYGMIAFASSLDQGGPMTRTAEDAALLLQAMVGFDPKDSTSTNEPPPHYVDHLNHSIEGLRIGLPEEYFNPLNSELAHVIESAINELVKRGATVKSIRLPNTNSAIPAYYVIAPAEASSNLARYDGVHYGYRCEDPKDILDLYTRTRNEGFGREVKRRIMAGTFLLSSGYYDAFYSRAQKVRQLIAQEYQTAFEGVDIILGPTAPGAACEIGQTVNDPIKMYKLDIYTVPASLAGLPALSIPCGFINGLPIGLQMIGNYFSEARLLNVAHQFQQITDWHQRCPDIALQEVTES